MKEKIKENDDANDDEIHEIEWKNITNKFPSLRCARILKEFFDLPPSFEYLYVEVVLLPM